MNETDRYVSKAIQGYFDINGKYPPRVEVSEELRCQLTQKSFVFTDTTLMPNIHFMSTLKPIECITVPVVPVGDDVAMPFFIRQVGIDPDDAQKRSEIYFEIFMNELNTKDIDAYIIEKTIKVLPYAEKQHVCDMNGVAYGYETIAKDLKEIIEG